MASAAASSWPTRERSSTRSTAGNSRKHPTTIEPVFGLAIPTACPGVPTELLMPRNTWSKPGAYDTKALHLAKLFQVNFAQYADQATPEVLEAGPKPNGTAERTALAAMADKTASGLVAG